MAKYQKEHLPDYTPKELELLKKKYTPKQLEALEAGEKAVDTQDMVIQGRLRDDIFRPTYIEDFTVTDPRYDLKPDLGGTPIEPKFPNEEEFRAEYLDKMVNLAQKKTGEQLTRAMVRAFLRVKQSEGKDLIDLTESELSDMEQDPSLLEKYLVTDPDEKVPKIKPEESDEYLTRAKALKLNELVDEALSKELEYLESSQSTGAELTPNALELLEDGPFGTISANTARGYDLGKVPGVAGLYKSLEKEDGDDTGKYTELIRLTGLTLGEIRSIYTKTIVTRYVHNQTRLGKIRSLSIMAIAGNGNGRLGIGIAKSTQTEVAINTATMLAIRNMKPIRRYENRTIYGNIKSKVSGTVVEISSRPPGMQNSDPPS